MFLWKTLQKISYPLVSRYLTTLPNCGVLHADFLRVTFSTNGQKIFIVDCIAAPLT